MSFILADAIDQDGDAVVLLGKNIVGEYELFDTTLGTDGEFRSLVFNGEPVLDGVEPGFTIIQAQQDGSGGYTVLLTDDGTTYLTGDVDGSGILTLDPFSPISVVDAEVLFGVLLNEDLIIGETVTITNTDTGVEDGLVIGVGNISGQYYVVDVNDVVAGDPDDTVSADLAISVEKTGGAPTLAGGSWSMIQVVSDGGTGYEALFTNGDVFTIQTLNSDGERLSAVTVDLADPAAVLAAETKFNTTIVEAEPAETVTITATDTGVEDGLVIGVGNISGQYYVVDVNDVVAGDPDDTVSADLAISVEKTGGAPTLAGGSWSMIQVVSDGGTGYEALFTNGDVFTIQTLNSDGERLSAVTVDLADPAAVLAAETKFNTTIVEAEPAETVTITATDTGVEDGLVIGVGNISGQYYVVDVNDVVAGDPDDTVSADLAISVEKTGGAPTLAGGSWSMIQVVSDGGTGYEALFTNGDVFTIQTLNSDGERLSAVTVDLADPAAVLAAETKFNTTIVEAEPAETVTITATDTGVEDGLVIGVGNISGQYYVVDVNDVVAGDPDDTVSADLAISVEKTGGAPTLAGGSWSMIQVVSDGGTGYEALFTNGDVFTIQTLNSDGERLSAVTVDLADPAAVLAAETKFNTTIVEAEPAETVTITATDTGVEDGLVIGVGNISGQYYVVDVNDVVAGDPDDTVSADLAISVEKTGGAPTLAGGSWSMIQVVSDGGTGYEALFTNGDVFTIQTLNSDGERLSAVTVDLADPAAVLAAETKFNTTIVEAEPAETVTITATDTGVEDGLVIGVGNISGQYYVVDVNDVVAGDPDDTVSADLAISVEKTGGAPTLAGGSWSMIQVVSDGGTGYEALFTNGDVFTIQTLNSDGERLSAVTVDLADPAAVLAAETKFNTTIVEAEPAETVTITATDTGVEDGLVIGVGNISGQYYVVDVNDVVAGDPDDTVSADLAISVEKTGGAPTLAGGSWSMIQVVSDGGTGYEALFTNGDVFTIQTLNSDGERLSAVTVDLADPAAVSLVETKFGTDIVGYGFVSIEGNGTIDLLTDEANGQYYVDNGVDPAIGLTTFADDPQTADEFTFIQAELDGGNLKLLFEDLDLGVYYTAEVDEFGVLNGDPSSVLEIDVIAAEILFDVDLNGGGIGFFEVV